MVKAWNMKLALLVMVVALFGALLMTACTDEPEPEPTAAEPTPVPTAAPTAVPTAEPTQVPATPTPAPAPRPAANADLRREGHPDTGAAASRDAYAGPGGGRGGPRRVQQ